MSKILVVDDHKNVLKGMRTLLGDKHEVTLCNSGCSALEVIKRTNFDIALIDMFLGDISGNEVLRKIKESHDDTTVVIISAYNIKDFIIDATRLGAADYILKPFDNNELLNLIDNLLRKKGLNKTVKDTLITKRGKFSDMDIQIMQLLCEGKLNKEIAEDLKRKESYVKIALHKIYLRLGAKNRIEAVRKILNFR